jgi:hypothetical protein
MEQIPRSLQIREIQWRIRVVTYKWMVLADSGTNMNLIGDENGLVKKYVSPRIESDDYSQTKDYEVDEELNLHLQIKDLFNGGEGEEYFNPRTI